MKFSTGLRNYLLDTGSLKSALDGGVILIYSGTEPDSADDAVPDDATLLCVVTADDTDSLHFGASAVNGLLSKDLSEIWYGDVEESGEASWFRFVTQSDTGAASTSELRIQGSIAVAGADMQITNVNLNAGAQQNIDYFSIYQPE